jgi:hypothetical protein
VVSIVPEEGGAVAARRPRSSCWTDGAIRGARHADRDVTARRIGDPATVEMVFGTYGFLSMKGRVESGRGRPQRA